MEITDVEWDSPPPLCKVYNDSTGSCFAYSIVTDVENASFKPLVESCPSCTGDAMAYWVVFLAMYFGFLGVLAWWTSCYSRMDVILAFSTPSFQTILFVARLVTFAMGAAGLHIVSLPNVCNLHVIISQVCMGIAPAFHFILDNISKKHITLVEMTSELKSIIDDLYSGDNGLIHSVEFRNCVVVLNAIRQDLRTLPKSGVRFDHFERVSPETKTSAAGQIAGTILSMLKPVVLAAFNTDKVNVGQLLRVMEEFRSYWERARDRQTTCRKLSQQVSQIGTMAYWIERDLRDCGTKISESSCLKELLQKAKSFSTDWSSVRASVDKFSAKYSKALIVEYGSSPVDEFQPVFEDFCKLSTCLSLTDSELLELLNVLTSQLNGLHNRLQRFLTQKEMRIMEKKEAIQEEWGILLVVAHDTVGKYRDRVDWLALIHKRALEMDGSLESALVNARTLLEFVSSEDPGTDNRNWKTLYTLSSEALTSPSEESLKAPLRTLKAML